MSYMTSIPVKTFNKIILRSYQKFLRVYTSNCHDNLDYVLFYNVE